MGIGAPQSCRSACCRMIGSRGAFCRPSAVAPGVPGTWGGGSMWSARVNRLRSYGTVIAKTGDLNMFCLGIAEAGMRFQARSHNCFRSRATMRGSAWGSRPMAAAAQGAACASAAGAGPAVLLQSGTVRRSPPAGGGAPGAAVAEVLSAAQQGLPGAAAGIAPAAAHRVLVPGVHAVEGHVHRVPRHREAAVAAAGGQRSLSQARSPSLHWYHGPFERRALAAGACRGVIGRQDVAVSAQT